MLQNVYSKQRHTGRTFYCQKYLGNSRVYFLLVVTIIFQVQVYDEQSSQ